MSRRSHHIDQAVGLRIAARRSALGWSQSVLGRELGVSFQQVQKYETGANRVSASRLHQAATAMGCSVADFFPARPSVEGEVELVHPVLASAEGRGLAEAFARIPDAGARRALTRVAQAMAGA
ncbi:XRE family transcriptional regulator [Brevundimonas diminuta]|jgi:transcriptional regulator with XRE-family HTH domain|uniref:Helix-turn-helix transcriptional regulator n=1 Tax=Brevundimonas diminuta TaxID=293 RepID=A0A410NUN8_BREDI|nr:helix-turn-helix transcriptional regulator [Brevundimonas diminuta]MBD3571954.1 XRE family transcriptional regulator [Brevundimonas diminuta]QAT13575.1 XRE family transcriptional regulator [Brevundimonas diminuta]QQB89061.1 helix-turn-helix transcriptional regulator [Brevundimonas diminuta]GEB99172.1 transcriptional regulator [Brevundimonas diminuta]